jgi:hypothetical protein
VSYVQDASAAKALLAYHIGRPVEARGPDQGDLEEVEQWMKAS